MKNSGPHTKKRNKLNEIDWKILRLKLWVGAKNEKKIEFRVVFQSLLCRSDQVFNSMWVFVQLLQIIAIKIYTTNANFSNVDTKHENKSDFFPSHNQQLEVREIKCEFYGLSYQIMCILVMFSGCGCVCARECAFNWILQFYSQKVHLFCRRNQKKCILFALIFICLFRFTEIQSFILLNQK